MKRARKITDSNVKIKREKHGGPAASSSNNTTVGVNPAEIEARIIELCQAYPKVVSDKTLQNDMPNLDSGIRVETVNRLLKQGKIDLFSQNNELSYKLKDTSSAGKIKGADVEEKVVYKIVEESGNKGILDREIRSKSNLIKTQLNKILKALQDKKLIKQVSSVAQANKKVYMLYDMEPDRSITGGVWYSSQDFESELIEILNQQIHRYLQQKAEAARGTKGGPIMARNASYATSKEILK